MTPIVDRRNLAPDLSISRVLTGLWQLADMERDGRKLDVDRTAAAMRPLVEELHAPTSSSVRPSLSMSSGVRLSVRATSSTSSIPG